MVGEGEIANRSWLLPFKITIIQKAKLLQFDFHFVLTNLVTTLASTEVWFNCLRKSRTITYGMATLTVQSVSSKNFFWRSKARLLDRELIRIFKEEAKG